MTKDDVKKLYEHSFLEISEDDLEDEVESINEVLSYADQIFEISVEGVEPLEMVSTHSARLREDKEEESLDREEALRNAHDREYGYFRLKKVL